MRTKLLPGMLLILGMTLGFFAVRTLTPSPTPAPAPQINKASVTHPPEAKEPEPPAKPDVTPALTNTSAPSLKDALDRINVPLPARASGTGIIKGTVRRENGTVLPGVKISLTPNKINWPDRPPHRRYGSREELDPAAQLMQLISQQRGIEAVRRTTVSDSDGRYIFADLDNNTFTMSSLLKGFEIIPAGDRDRVWAIKPDAEIDLVATPVVEILCTVRMPDGSSPASAYINCNGNPAARNTGFSWSPDDRSIILTPGHYDITARAGEHNQFKSAVNSVDIPAVNAPSLEFTLKESPGITGRVKFPKGTKPDFIPVHAAAIRDGTIPDADALVRSGYSSYVSPHNGYTFNFPEMPAGEFAVAIVDQGRSSILAMERVTVGTGLVNCELTPGFPARSEYLVVHATGPDGKPVTDLNLTTRSSTGASARGGIFMSGRNPDGSWWVMNPADDKADSTFTVTAISPLYGRRTVEYARTETSEATILFKGVAALKVTVAGYKHGPETQGMVVRLKESGGATDYASGNVNTNGTAVLEKLAPGTHTLTLLPAICGNWPLVRTTVTLTAGTNEVAVSPPPLYQVTVSVKDPAYGKNVHLRPLGIFDGDPTAYLNLDPETRTASLNGLPAGQYSFTMVHGEKTGRMIINVPQQSNVDFEAQPLNAIDVTVTSPEGYLARAGFRTGDIIVGINGVQFKQINTIQELLDAYTGTGEALLTILRDGKAAYIKADVGRMKGNGPDGRLTSTTVNLK